MQSQRRHFVILPFFIVLLPVCGSDVSGLPEGNVTDTLSHITVVSEYKQAVPLERLASPVTSLYLKELEEAGVLSPKDLSGLVPNLHIPDYGSAMTSSIYMRGFGSRIDNPVMGLYVDDIPVMNKNSYDTGLMDIRSINVLRGPQGTLYGRNSMCGVMSVNTLSPSLFAGTRGALSYGTANSFLARVSSYGRTSSGAALGGIVGYRHTDGYYTNIYDGSRCDPSDELQLRFRAEKQLRPDLSMDNILSVSALRSGGWAYGLYSDEGSGYVLNPVEYNDRCGYGRVNVTEGLKFRLEKEKYLMYSVTSWQLLLDRMDLDQDFTPASMFTLTQIQRENALTQEIILRPRRDGIWDWQTGAFVFGKYNSMSAPVQFKEDGIRKLILDNANANMPDDFGDLQILEDRFVIGSDFGIVTFGAAVYHESYLDLGNWLVTAGLRLDYEGHLMNYHSTGNINYRLTGWGDAAGYVPLNAEYRGHVFRNYFEVIPKVSVQYDFTGMPGNSDARLYVSAAKGYKAGGFNTQIFSDILQNRIMEEIGVSLTDNPVTADNTVYGPESDWNFELGGNISIRLPGISHRLDISASVYHILCRNQQITLFPPGLSTGRMMANVGKSSSTGAEMQADYRAGGFFLALSGGYSYARFVDYDDGRADYSGNRIPYSPEFTARGRAGYDFRFTSDAFRGITIAAGCSAVGRIWWEESNSPGLVQRPYALLDADVTLRFKWFDLYVRGYNLTSEDYCTFYFKSVGNSFLQKGKPFRLEAGVDFEF